MIRRPPRSTLDRSSAASDVYKRQQSAISKCQKKRVGQDGAVGEKALKLRDIRLWSDLPMGAKVVYFKREGLVVKHWLSVFKNWSGRSGMCVGSLISCSRSLRMLNDSASTPPKSV